VNIQLIGIIAGLVFGVSWTALVAAYLFYTRSSRMAHNQYAIRLGQLLVGRLSIGSFLLLLRLWEQIGLVIHTHPHYMPLYAFVLSSGCVVFFAVGAEIRWRKSSGLDQTTRKRDTGFDRSCTVDKSAENRTVGDSLLTSSMRPSLAG
jgi:hypothetical protein